MNIVIATGIFPPAIGGPATYSKILAEELSKRGHTITVVTYGEKTSTVKNQNEELQFKTKNISKKIPKGLRHAVYFWRVMQSAAAADIIYAQDAVSAGLPASAAAFLLRKKFVLKVVGDYAWEQGMQRFGVVDLLDDFLKKRYGFRVQFLRWVEAFIANSACRVIVPSVYLKSVVRAWGVPDSCIVVLYNFVHKGIAAGTKEEVRKKYNLNGITLLSAGRLVPWKGFRMLITLMPDLLAERKDIRLVVIGDGPERLALESLVRDLHMQNHVRIMGAVAKDVLAEYLVAADIFLLNTGYEGFSHQLLEALAYPLPIITTDAGGNKEIVQDKDKTDFLIAAYNDKEAWKEQILRVLKDNTIREKLSQNKNHIQKIYDKGSSIQETLDVLTQI